MIVIDFETLAIGVRPTTHPPVPVGLAYYDPHNDQSGYLAWGHPEGNTHTKEQAQAFLLSHWGKNKLLMHNAQFDLEVAQTHFGLPELSQEWFEDTLILAFLHDPHAKSHALKELAQTWLGIAPNERDELRFWVLNNVEGARRAPTKWGAHISKVPADMVAPYAIADCTLTYRLYQWLTLRPFIQMMFKNCAGFTPEEPLYKPQLNCYEREKQCMVIMTRNSGQGLRVDVNGIASAITSGNQAIADATVWLRKRLNVDETVNLDSDRQLVASIQLSDAWNPIGIPWPKTASGQYAADKETLQAMITDPILRDVLRYRGQMQTIIGTFLEPWYETAQETGRIYCTWNMTRGEAGGARTGRMCVHGDTLLETSRGTFRIEDYEWQEGDTIETHLGRRRKILQKIYKGVEEMVEVVCEDGSVIKCTTAHRLLTPKGWQHVRELTCTDTVYSGRIRERSGVDKLDDISQETQSRLTHNTQSQSAHFCGGPSLSAGAQDVVFQNGQKEPDVWQERGSTSQLEGRGVGGRSRLSDSALERQADLYAPSGDARSVRFGENAKELGNTPHRWGQNEQPLEQSSTIIEWGAQTLTHTRVQAIYTIGRHPVWDIEVEEDRSYIAQGLIHHNSSSPNFQNIPREPAQFTGLPPELTIPLPSPRHFLLADEGHKLVSADFSGQELRIFAHFCAGPLTDKYQAEPAADMHSYAAELMQPACPFQITRQHAKALNFAILYGAGPSKLGLMLGISPEEANVMLNAYKRQVAPGLDQMQTIMKMKYRAKQPIRSLGLRLIPPEPPKLVKGRVMDLSFKSTNMLIQASGSDQAKASVIEYDKIKHPQARIFVAIHDEIVISCPEEVTETESAKLIDVMCSAIPMNVPVLADYVIGDNLGDCK